MTPITTCGNSNSLRISFLSGFNYPNRLVHLTVSLIAFLFFSLAGAPEAHATWLLEDFCYGNLVLYGNLSSFNGGSGWGTNTWQTASTHSFCQTNRLLYLASGYRVNQTAGNGAFYANYPAYRGAYRMVGANLTNVVWFSALMQAGTGQQAYIGFNSTGTNSSGSPYPSTAYSIGISNDTLVVAYGGNTSGGWSGSFTAVTNLTVNATHLVLGCICFNSNTTNCLLQVWADPANLSNLSPALFQQSGQNMGSSLFNVCVGSAAVSNGVTGGVVSSLRFSDGNGSPAQGLVDVTDYSTPPATWLTEDFAYGNLALYGNLPIFNGGSDWGTNTWQTTSGRCFCQTNRLLYSAGGYQVAQAVNSGTFYANYSAYRGAYRMVGTNLTNVVWFSALMQAGTGQQAYLGFNTTWTNSPGNYYPSTAYSVGISNDTLVVGFGGNTSGGWSGSFTVVTNLAPNATHLVLGYISFNANGANSLVQVWADPANLANLGAASFQQSSQNIGSNLFNVCVGSTAISSGATGGLVSALRFSDGNGSQAQAFADIIGNVAPPSPPSGHVLVGAIRWDVWEDSFTNDGLLPWAESCLSPNQWHYRLPFFSQVLGSNSAIFNGNSQAIMDQEINYAANAGINYWAFDIYTDDSGMSQALHLYLKSGIKSRINFALLLQGSWVSGSSENYWTVQIPRYVNYFKNSSYQMVFGNRPLVYIYGPLDNTNAGYVFQTPAQAAAGIAALRAATTNAGLGNPYIVYQDGYAPRGYGYVTNYGLDALSQYAVFVGTTNGGPYSVLTSADKSMWAAQAAYTNVVPLVCAGIDVRDVNGTVLNGQTQPANMNYIDRVMPDELANHLLEAINWTANNSSTVTAANTVLIYAWNEHSEGGWICPTINTNDNVSPDTSRLDAIGNVLGMNLSFETPNTGGGWYPGSLANLTGFGWSNNLTGNALADATVGHFTSAADGWQALQFGVGNYISKDLGPTIADTSYSFTFSLLQDKLAPNSTSLVKVDVFDGTNSLASVNFTVPSTADIWQSNVCATIAPHQPVGDLIFQVTGIVGNPWIDNIRMNTQFMPAPVALTNASFEFPASTNSGWYTGGWLSTNSSFGWSNNLSHAFQLAREPFSSWSIPADGMQAVLLSGAYTPSEFVSQDTGATAADTYYSLSFSLEQGVGVGATATITAQIKDDTNVLASSNFSAPTMTNIWQKNTLTTLSPHQPTGRLMIKFTSVTNLVWLDDVSLTALQQSTQQPNLLKQNTLGQKASQFRVAVPPSIPAVGHFHVQFSGTAGYPYMIQCATNIAGPWVTVTNSTVGNNGLIDYEDTNTAQALAKFYRILGF